ncbi:MAG TPA: hypothetical protein VEB43_19245 [Anaeromyxobacter sp.]|nr:hypothetical protein [Anaeromyxobacter sp.]
MGVALRFSSRADPEDGGPCFDGTELYFSAELTSRIDFTSTGTTPLAGFQTEREGSVAEVNVFVREASVFHRGQERRARAGLTCVAPDGTRYVLIRAIAAGTITLAHDQTTTILVDIRPDDIARSESVCPGPEPTPACMWRYSEWGPCQPSNRRYRNVVGIENKGEVCEGLPITSESCSYVPPQPPPDEDDDGDGDGDGDGSGGGGGGGGGGGAGGGGGGGGGGAGGGGGGLRAGEAQTRMPECEDEDDVDDHDPDDRIIFTLPSKLFCHT